MQTTNKYKRHEEICKKLNEVYVQKNRAYGDSFSETYRKLGIISAVTRMTDKMNRIQNLSVNKNIDKGDESLIDSCLDLANYAIMTVMELEK